ncbi:integrin alpha, partial [Myxosarcina sp. GI1]|uniref:integrin alpha n=1 Tax=Myxosarcina sp. GI1 TaxID=1541065 RepID=UPI00055FCC4B
MVNIFALDNINGSNGLIINGIASGDRLGYSVSNAGDVNGDGIEDIIVGAPEKLYDEALYNDYFGEGKSYVIFGRREIDEDKSVDLDKLDGSNGFVINGIELGDGSGFSVSSAGDFNGDGINDLIIGAPNKYEFDSESGESYLVFGGTEIGSDGSIELSSLNGSNGFVIDGINVGDRVGFSVSEVGDINNDGFSDVIIGAPYADPDGVDRAGESYVIFGGNSVAPEGSLALSSLDGVNGFILESDSNYDYNGYAVSSAGDVNGDGIDDIIIGAPGSPYSYEYASNGKSYIIFGSSNLGSNGVVRLDALDGSNGFVINGIAEDDRVGSSVSSAGDFNDDGIDDLLIGAPLAAPNGNDAAGESYVVFGNSAPEIDLNG